MKVNSGGFVCIVCDQTGHRTQNPTYILNTVYKQSILYRERVGVMGVVDKDYAVL